MPPFPCAGDAEFVPRGLRPLRPALCPHRFSFDGVTVLPAAAKIEIFKPFTGKDANGNDVSFAASDVAGMATIYDPALHAAPLVVGHPKMDDPAYGWVNSLSIGPGDVLLAEPDQVEPAFAEMVKAGRFKRVSASFYSPASPTNPKPGHWYLKHVGFLGAVAPAVKGLKSVQFAAGDEDGIVAVEFAAPADQSSLAWAMRALGGIMGRLRDHFITEKGIEAANEIVPPWRLEDIQKAAGDLEGKASTSVFSETTPPQTTPPQNGDASVSEKDLAAREAELQKREADLAGREAGVKAKEVQFAEAAKVARRRDNETLLDGLIAEGKMRPTDKAAELAFMEALDGQAQTVEFADGDGVIKLTPLAAYHKRLKLAPKLVEFGEVAPGSGTPIDSVEFAAAGGFDVDRERAALHQKAMAYQAAHPGTEFLAAYKAVGGR